MTGISGGLFIGIGCSNPFCHCEELEMGSAVRGDAAIARLLSN